MSPSSCRDRLFVERVGQDEVVRAVASGLGLHNALENVLVQVAGLALHVADFRCNNNHFRDKGFAADQLNEQHLVIFGGQVPVEVLMVKQQDLWRASPQDAVCSETEAKAKTYRMEWSAWRSLFAQSGIAAAVCQNLPPRATPVTDPVTMGATTTLRPSSGRSASAVGVSMM